MGLPRTETIIEIFQFGFAGEHFHHLLGIVFPVSGAVNVAAETNFVDKHADEGLGDQTPFMMTSFAPWVWEVDVHASQRAVRNHVADDFDRVVANDARELFFKSALLRIGDMAAAQYKTANMAVLELFEFFWREFFLFHGESGQSSVPESARF